MDIQGNYILNISRQSGCQTTADFIFNDPFMVFSFGISGANKCNFLVSGSRVYDSNGNFIYAVNEIPLSLGLISDSSGCFYYANESPLSYISGNFGQTDYIYIENTGNLNLNLLVSGEKPQYYYYGYGNFNQSNFATGIIINNTPNRIFKINSGQVNFSNIPGITLSGWTSGDISGSGALSFYTNTVTDANISSGITNLTLFTNFGPEYLNIDFSANSLSGNGYVSLTPLNLNYIETSTPNDYIYESFYNLDFRPINIKLELISIGSGMSQFTGIWNMATGKDGAPLVDYRSNGWYDSNIYWNSGNIVNLPPNFISNGNIRVYFDGSQMSGSSVVKLSVNDSYNSGELYISGNGAL